MPDWSSCELCKRKFTDAEISSFMNSFHLRCNNCDKTKNTKVVSPEQREIFHNVQKLSPADFLEYVSPRIKSAEKVSTALKLIISQVIGKEVNIGKVVSNAEARTQ